MVMLLRFRGYTRQNAFHPSTLVKLTLDGCCFTERVLDDVNLDLAAKEVLSESWLTTRPKFRLKREQA